ncbi:carboxypeptidase-like regulatory domain-containing protein [Roseivirga pacifica]|uniref:carboxypeptidase-like regulatory domain-containing protein n=1 Tax=Roseivirga pacifica TaxID=1267423 RepID=UPI003BACB5EA
MKRLLMIVLLVGAAMAMPNEAEAQIFSTKLRLTVLDELGNIVKGAEVALYKTEADYAREENPVQEPMLTDQKGRVTFKKLAPMSYWVVVRKGDKDNAGGGEIVSKLEEGKLNKANVVISDGL